MEREGRGLIRMVAHEKDAVVPAADDVAELSPDDDAWLGKEPSATPDISWIEDDLQKTPVDERVATEPVPGTPAPESQPLASAARVPFSPELALTPPPATRRPAGTPPIRRPVIERVRPREKVRGQARLAPRAESRPQPRRVSVEVVPARSHLFLAYAGAIAAGVASGVAVLFFGQ